MMPYLVAKRTLDIVLAIMLLIIALPVMMTTAIVIKLDSKGPILFVQRRPGKNNKIFKLYKFRTMRIEAEYNGKMLTNLERVTRVGSFLRKASIDELPQLFNIIRGDMSFIGPRPLLIKYLPYYTEEEIKRHNVLPGITGWAQVNGRNNLNWEKRFKMDLEYVEKVTFLFDLRIFFITIYKIFKRADVVIDALTDLDIERRRKERERGFYMNDGINILITSAGRRTRLLEYFKKELKAIGNLIAADCSALAPALYTADKHFIVPRIDDPRYIDAIKIICIEEKINGVLSLIDPELSLLAKYTEELNEIGVTAIVSSYEECELWLDKYASAKFFEDNGFNHAKTYNSLLDFEKGLENGEIAFPVFIKPRKGSASLNINKAVNMKQVELLMESSKDMIIQELLVGEELGVDVYVDLISKKVVSIFAKEKIAMRAGETDKAKSIKPAVLFTIIEELVAKAGLIGAIDIDVFHINGEYYISEINPRFGGGYPIAYECGANFPRYIINNLKGIVNEPRIGNYDENIFLMKHDTLTIKTDLQNYY